MQKRSRMSIGRAVGFVAVSTLMAHRGLRGRQDRRHHAQYQRPVVHTGSIWSYRRS